MVVVVPFAMKWEMVYKSCAYVRWLAQVLFAMKRGGA